MRALKWPRIVKGGEGEDEGKRGWIKLTSPYDSVWPRSSSNIITTLGQKEGSQQVIVKQRHLEEPYVDQLSVTDLIQLEKEFDAALTQIKSRKSCFRIVGPEFDDDGVVVGLLHSW
ncbi:hypothetical protein CsSME_00021600 [Camellia sinensis var. sinensis]